jgi:hypothetical protein
MTHLSTRAAQFVRLPFNRARRNRCFRCIQLSSEESRND